jgi:hypothetical protein
MSRCFMCENKFCQGALQLECSDNEKFEVCRIHSLLPCVHKLTYNVHCWGKPDQKCISLCSVNGCDKTVPFFITGKHSYKLNNFVGSHNRCPEHYKTCWCGNRLSRLGFGDACVGCSKVLGGPPTLLVLMILRRYFNSETTKLVMSHLKIIQRCGTDI